MTMSDLHDREAEREATGNYHRGDLYTIPGPRVGPACHRGRAPHEWVTFQAQMAGRRTNSDGSVSVLQERAASVECRACGKVRR